MAMSGASPVQPGKCGCQRPHQIHAAAAASPRNRTPTRAAASASPVTTAPIVAPMSPFASSALAAKPIGIGCGPSHSLRLPAAFRVTAWPMAVSTVQVGWKCQRPWLASRWSVVPADTSLPMGNTRPRRIFLLSLSAQILQHVGELPAALEVAARKAAPGRYVTSVRVGTAVPTAVAAAADAQLK